MKPLWLLREMCDIWSFTSSDDFLESGLDVQSKTGAVLFNNDESECLEHLKKFLKTVGSKHIKYSICAETICVFTCMDLLCLCSLCVRAETKKYSREMEKGRLATAKGFNKRYM